jgi:hypothetical protein
MVTEVIERVDIVQPAEAPGISWRAILGGAVVMAAVAFILTALGAAFGLSAISPWQDQSASPKEFAILTGIWLIVVQWLSAGIGGYMAGRLGPETLTRPVGEIAFRDTARGIIAWAVAAVITAIVLGSAVSSLIGGAAHGATTIAASAVQGAAQGATQNANPGQPGGYLVDTLFRKASPDTNMSAQDASREATRIIASGLHNGDLSQPDRAYLAQLVAVRTGLSQDDVQKRVEAVVTEVKQDEEKAKEAAETARKAARNIAFFIAFSMLVGAFIAGVAGKIGGHHRDAVI